jgi:peptidoglycan/LPS O-acetylase OafA/YrhL
MHEILGDEYTRFTKSKKFGSLDGLRALAIVAVVWHHAGVAVPGWQITSRGFLGVDLFFVISGFLIVTLLLREQDRTGTISLFNFYVRRFLRIFPPYYLLLFVVGIVAYLKPGGNQSEAVKHDLPYALLYVSDLVPMYSQLSITWSLAVEEQFYVFIPTLLKIPTSLKYLGRASPILLVFAYVLSSLLPFGIFPALHLPEFFRQTTFGPILLGAMLAYVFHERRWFICASRFLGLPVTPLVVLGLLLVLVNWSPADISGWPRVLMHWSMLALVASCVVREDNVLAPFLSLKPVKRLGVVSYGVYLYHLVVMHFVLKGLSVTGASQGVMAFVVTLLGTWALAELSYRFFESRFLALKARFGSYSTQPPEQPSESQPISAPS